MGFLAVELPIRRHAALGGIHQPQKLLSSLRKPFIAASEVSQKFTDEGVNGGFLLGRDDTDPVEHLVVDRERDVFHISLQYTVYVELCAVFQPFLMDLKAA